MSLIGYLTKIHFAEGIVGDVLPCELERLGIRHVFLVTDEGAVENGLFERVKPAIPTNISVTLYDQTPENPTESASIAATEIYDLEGCDGIIALGGGSVIDLAKVIGLLASHDGRLSTYAVDEGGITRIRDVLPPIIAIPTTAGTGSEVGCFALIVDDAGRKLGLVSPHLIPMVAICDPELTVTLNPFLTAATGMDALTHCIETFIATAYNPPADGIALDGLKRAAANIERAVENGRNIHARREMMAAAMEGALALQKGLGGVHAISHALYDIDGHRFHHGTLNAVLLPYVLEFNEPAVGERYDDLKLAMKLNNGANLSDHIRRLNERIDLPASLCEMGVDLAAIDRAAPLAERDHTNATNPRKASAADYRDIMRAAL